ncbi:MAG: response regulator [Candidatus Promineifilaceae bacterium]|nr:response regulator [Anaerolineaceae bacterium]
MQESILSGVALVIDDQEAILSVVEDMLTARGMGVLLAPNGPAGIALFTQHHETIDVVLLDYKMPGMSGDQVFFKLKAIAPGVQVIVASGFSKEETLDYFENHPDITFLQKPYRFQGLIETVGGILAKSL